MKKIELEVLTTAFQIELNISQIILIFYDNTMGEIKSIPAWWDNERSNLLYLHNDEKVKTSFIGWCKLPTFEK